MKTQSNRRASLRIHWTAQLSLAAFAMRLTGTGRTRRTGPWAAMLLGLLSFSSQAQIWRWYDENPDYKPNVLRNGSMANFSSWTKALPVTRLDSQAPRAVPVAEKVWMIYGIFYGPVIIETPKGLLVFSSGENDEDGRNFRAIIRRDVSTKPIIALFYDHAHYAKGAQTLLDGDPAMIVAHPDSNRIMQDSGFLANPYIPEMLPTLDGRARIHFATDLPASGVDAKLGSVTLDLGKKSAWMPATKTLADGERMSIDGVEIQAFHAVTDTEDTLTFWLPQRKIVVDNVMWPTVPNLYTLRGDRYRDPALWISAIKKIRDLEPEIVLDVGGGAKPLVGKDNIRETTNAVIDATSFIYDQTIRLTNQGMRMQELRHHIVMPESLLKHPYVNEAYGQFDTWPEAIAAHNHGWFSGHAEDLHALPRAEESKRWIALAGGEPAVLKAFTTAMEKKHYLWAKALAVALYDMAPDNKTYRQNLANVFRALGQYSPGSISRHFYTAGARSLEGELTHTLGAVQDAEWVTANPPRAIDHLRTRLNPHKALHQEGVLEFALGAQRMALHVRNATAEFVANPQTHYRKADAVIRTSPEQFARYFRGELRAAELVKAAGADQKAAALLSLFDEYRMRPLYAASAE